MKIHASGEDYLEAILVLQKKMGMVRSIDLARHMGFSKPSISHAVSVLKNGGFLTVDDDGFLHLTAIGREIAEKIYERHLFFINPFSVQQRKVRLLITTQRLTLQPKVEAFRRRTKLH